MNDHDGSTTEDSPEGEEDRQALVRLLEEVLEYGGDEEEKRQAVVEYCESRGIEESRMWNELALYHRDGPAADDPFDRWKRGGFFDDAEERLRGRIVALIGRLPEETVGDFTALLDFRRQFLQRIQYVCDLVVYFFLEREKGEWRESENTAVYVQFINHKLFREFSAINDIVIIDDSIKHLGNRYLDWILDRALDEEAPV